MQRVLIVDDEPINRIVLLALLEDLGASVDQACDGAEALRALADKSYDLLLLDIHMPILDGMQVAARLRSEPGHNRDIPIVAVTGDGARSLDDYRALGFDGLVEKPISLATIRRSLHVARGGPQGG